MANFNVGNFVKQFTEKAKEAVEKSGAVPGSDNPAFNSVILRANPANVGVIFLGDSNVTEANGFPLAKGDSVSMDIQSLGTVFGFAEKANDKLHVLYLTS